MGPPALRKNHVTIGPVKIHCQEQKSSPAASTYLAAFAETAGLTLVTLDKALAEKARGAVLLSSGQ